MMAAREHVKKGIISFVKKFREEVVIVKDYSEINE